MNQLGKEDWKGFNFRDADSRSRASVYFFPHFADKSIRNRINYLPRRN